MKTKSIIAMSLMAALAAGCSSDDIVDDGGKKPGITEGKSYVSMNITLPTTNGTRAEGDENNPNNENTLGNTSAGEPKEYKVNKVKITFYQNSGTDENPNYQLISGQDPLEYNSEELAWATSSVAGVTTTALLPVKQVTFKEDVTAYALVEVNPITKEGWAVNTANEAKEITASDLTGNAQDAFFMTNTVWNDGSYLVKIHSYKTELEARNHANDYNIYVERAVAKATLKVGTEGWVADSEEENAPKHTYAIPAEEEGKTNVYAEAKVKIAGWKLDVTNKKMYPIRKFKGDDENTGYKRSDYGRFYGVVNYGNYNRTYWAEDPNYADEDYTEDYPLKNAFDTLTASSVINNAVGSNEYCLENTFNTKHQKQNETTRMVVKAIYTPKFNEDEKAEGDGATWYTIGNSTKAYTTSSLQAKIKEVLGITDESVSVTLSTLPAGKTDIDNTTFTVSGVTDGTAISNNVTKVQNVLGRTITTYKDGKCYYAIRIKHFGDGVCPWETGYDYLTGENEKGYLGRYGMVRNNWYQVTINKVTQPGSPTIPALTDKQDDEQYYYLQANINILDWAVRTQGVEL